MRLKWKNKDKLFRKLIGTVPRIAAELAAANKKSAVDFVELARRLAPYEDGDLQESIRMTRGSRSTAYIVEAGGRLTTRLVRNGQDGEYDYALGQEFGTRDIPAQPFFFPAFRTVKRTHKGRATRALRKAIKRAGF